MGPGSILLAITFAFLATCTTAAKGDHTRMLKVSSPDFARANDAVSNKVRLLRSNEVDDDETNNEEKGGLPNFSFQKMASNSLANSGRMVRKAQVTWKKARLTSDADIMADYKTLSQWYKNGKPLEDARKELDPLYRQYFKRTGIEEFLESQEYRRVVTYEKFDKIMKDPKLSKAPLQRTDEIIQAQKWQQMRSEDVKLMQARLKSDADINADFPMYLLWYKRGDTPEDAKTNVAALYRQNPKSNEKFIESQDKLYATYKRFYDMMEKMPSKKQLRLERGDEVRQKMAQLTSHADINDNFNLYWLWYMKGNTIGDVWIGLKLRPLQQQYLKEANGLANFKKNLDYQLYVGYNKFYKIMKGEMPKTAA